MCPVVPCQAGAAAPGSEAPCQGSWQSVRGLQAPPRSALCLAQGSIWDLLLPVVGSGFAEKPIRHKGLGSPSPRRGAPGPGWVPDTMFSPVPMGQMCRHSGVSGTLGYEAVCTCGCWEKNPPQPLPSSLLRCCKTLPQCPRGAHCLVLGLSHCPAPHLCVNHARVPPLKAQSCPRVAKRVGLGWGAGVLEGIDKH